MAPPCHWHLITGEYPPDVGGVSDYTRALAEGLADRGCDVHVWCPTAAGESPHHAGVTVHAVAGSWTRPDLRRLDAQLDATPAPRRLLVQWVPHAFGRRSLNVAFCAWVRSRGRRGDRVDLIVHEAFLGFGEGSWRQDAAAAVHRLMVTLLLQVTTTAWVTIPAWAASLRRYTWGRHVRFCWLPVPSSVPVDDHHADVQEVRSRFDRDALVIGHFGTYNVQSRRDLTTILPKLLDRHPSAAVLLLGRDSDGCREAVISRHPQHAGRIIATGALDPRTLSHALQACDVMAQPYSDGASTRRTTLMAALAHGLPTVTTIGRLSDKTWTQADAVVGVPVGNPEAFVDAVGDLMADPGRRAQLGERARQLYATRFDGAHTISALLADTCEVV